MEWVLLTALAVGVATLVGAAIGLMLRRINESAGRCMVACAAGIMLQSALFGLIEPALEMENRLRVPLLFLGLFLGFLFLSALRALSPRLFGKSKKDVKTNMLLFVLALGIHHIPEGIAAGVSFGTGNAEDIMTVAGGIALQNIPEGMVLIAPLLALGLSRFQTILISVGIALLEAAGVFGGYFAIRISYAMLPLLLGFAAGTMLYVMLTDMIPDACRVENGQKPTYFALMGFCLMILISVLF